MSRVQAGRVLFGILGGTAGLDTRCPEEERQLSLQLDAAISGGRWSRGPYGVSSIDADCAVGEGVDNTAVADAGPRQPVDPPPAAKGHRQTDAACRPVRQSSSHYGIRRTDRTYRGGGPQGRRCAGTRARMRFLTRPQTGSMGLRSYEYGAHTRTPASARRFAPSTPAAYRPGIGYTRRNGRRTLGSRSRSDHLSAVVTGRDHGIGRADGRRGLAARPRAFFIRPYRIDSRSGARSWCTPAG